MRSRQLRVVVRAILVPLAVLAASPAVQAQETAATSGRAAPPEAAPGTQTAPPPGRLFVTPPLGDGPWDIETEKARLHVTVVTKGLDHPWGMVFLPNGDMLVTERPGRLRVIRGGALDPTPIGGLPAIRAAVIGGLQDIALHPRFEQNRLVYFAYSKPDSQDPTVSTLAVGRARWDGGPTLTNFEDVFVAGDWYGQAMARGNGRCCGQGPADGSYGARMVFDAEGLLYVTSGDRNWGEKSQDPSSHLGKIVRIRDDGTIPDDNPFLGKEGYQPELYTIGHRNPTGLAIHPVTGELWSTEFGPRGGDELNRLEAGKNYGWILVTEGTHYNNEPTALGKNSVPGMVDPVLFWVPSINPGNFVFYNGDRFPGWRGNMLMASMSRSLLRVEFDAAGHPTHQERMLTDLRQRLRDVRQGPDGSIYVLTDETAGVMLRIEPGT
jgi:glucose/arabinose dehydrogenase